MTRVNETRTDNLLVTTRYNQPDIVKNLKKHEESLKRIEELLLKIVIILEQK